MNTRNSFVLAALVGIGIFTAGCGNETHDDVADDGVKVMEEFAAAIESAKDESSAKAAGAKIDELAERMKKISERSKALPKMTEDEKKAMEAKYKPRIEAVMQKMMGASFAVMSKPDVAKHLEGPMERFGKAGEGAEIGGK